MSETNQKVPEHPDNSAHKQQQEKNSQPKQKLEQNERGKPIQDKNMLYVESPVKELREWVDDSSYEDFNSCLASINDESVNQRYEEVKSTFPEHFQTETKPEPPTQISGPPAETTVGEPSK